jgi:hypothetical protein
MLLLQHRIEHRQRCMYASVLAVHGLVMVRQGPGPTTGPTTDYIIYLYKLS